MSKRNRGHEVDPVEGTSSRKKIHRFFPRAAQGPHKVRTRSTLAGSSRGPIWLKFGGNVDKTWSGKRGSQESLRVYGFLCICYDLFSGVGSVGSPEFLKTYRFSCIVHNFFGGVGLSLIHI